jgi:hypothetical protein
METKPMRTLQKLIWIALACALCAPAPASPTADGSGQVEIPLDVYNQLVASAADPTLHPRPAPASHALGSALITVDVPATEPRASATVGVELTIDVLEDDWALIPVLPAGTPVEMASVNGQAVQLMPSPLGLAWSTRVAGSYTMQLTYRVDAIRSPGGFSLGIPLPAAAAIRLSASLPGTGLDATVIPAAGVNVATSGERSVVTATIPTAGGVQISWRAADELGHAISRASYEGQLVGDAVVWTSHFMVELFTDETITLPLLSRSVALSALEVDGEQSPILVDEKNQRFQTRLRGRGMHEVTLVFEVQVDRSTGPPRVELQIPQIPVSRFELVLPGKKELTIEPASNVTRTEQDEQTTATVHVPMSDRVSFSWSEAVPEDVRTEIRANASTVHTVYAEEGVLYVHAMLHYEVTRGKAGVIELLLPPDVQISRISDDSGAVTDWRISERGENEERIVTVFLDRELEGELFLDLHYDRSLNAGAAVSLQVPLVWLTDAQRQRGMVALLSSTDLALEPVAETALTAVGENQLPAYVRDAVQLTVAHTYKYAETLPSLVVRPTTPERAQGKFDAQVDTLISLGDVTLAGAASVEINVKSGRIMALQLTLPDEVNLLSLSAPSVRTHRVVETESGQRIDVEFTQEMEGQFRLDLAYERITVDVASELEVPTVSVPEAEVEQGRIAVEALSAVEVQPAVTQQLTGLDIAELPRQLVLRTTNPILLAYKYVHANPPHRLALAVTRHPVLDIQEAVIDSAEYRTLFTPDGLLVTTARFSVRNSRKQFLRVELPHGAEVWSAFVDGKPEQPALATAEGEEAPQSVLIKILNSTEGFPVELVYASTGSRLRGLGAIEGSLPRPDILVTRSRWDVYLPDAMQYGNPQTNMRLVSQAQQISREEMTDELRRLEQAVSAPQAIRPLQISVPTSGVHYAFEKIYANQADERSWFEIPYASRSGARLGQAVSLLGVMLFWVGVVLRVRGVSLLAGASVATLGLAIVLVAVLVYHSSATLPAGAALAIGIGLLVYRIRLQPVPRREAQPVR